MRWRIISAYPIDGCTSWAGVDVSVRVQPGGRKSGEIRRNQPPQVRFSVQLVVLGDVHVENR